MVNSWAIWTVVLESIVVEQSKFGHNWISNGYVCMCFVNSYTTNQASHLITYNI